MRVLGIDCSTKKLSWSIVNDGDLEAYDEIFFEGTDFIKRYKDVRYKVLDNIDKFEGVEYIAFEKAVLVRSADVALKLAGIFAVAMSCLGEIDAKMVEVEPVTWQSAIGNPIIRGEAKKKLLASQKHIKTKSAQTKFIRDYRKGLTLGYVKKRTGVELPNDDLGDSAGIALFIYDRMKEMNDG